MPQKRQYFKLSAEIPPEAATKLFVEADRARMTPSRFLAHVITNIFAPDALEHNVTSALPSSVCDTTPDAEGALPPLTPPDPKFRLQSSHQLREHLFVAALSSDIISNPRTQSVAMALRFNAATPAEQRTAILNNVNRQSDATLDL